MSRAVLFIRTVIHTACTYGLLASALAAIALPAQAQLTVLAERTVNPNGRTVQEIRIGADPSGTTQLRTVVITNGPTAGTTSLLTSVTEVNALLAGTGPAPTWTTVIAAGTAFSLGGGCRRGNQLDFPFIDANRPKLLRFVGSAAGTVIDVPVTDNNLYDSADCVATSDQTTTYFIYSNRSLSRLPLFRDTGIPTDLVNSWVTFSSVKTPFVGGLRPAIATLPESQWLPGSGPHVLALMFMRTDGQTRWHQYDASQLNINFNCLAGTQSPPPSAFTIPRGSAVIGHQAAGDFDGDGIAEIVTFNKGTPPNCIDPPVSTPFGNIAGSAFNWIEFSARRFDNGSGLIIGNQMALLPPPLVLPSTLGTAGGSHASINVISAESQVDAELAVAMDVLNQAFNYQLVRSTFVPTPAPSNDELLYGCDMEALARIDGFTWTGH
jgi:hypothetical protein